MKIFHVKLASSYDKIADEGTWHGGCAFGGCKLIYLTERMAREERSEHLLKTR